MNDAYEAARRRLTIIQVGASREQTEQIVTDLGTIFAHCEAKNALLREVYFALIRAGWHDDELLRRVKAAGEMA